MLALVLLFALVAALALDAKPTVDERSDISLDDIQHALAVARSHDPRRSIPGQLTQLTVTERDVDLLLNHAARRMLGMRVALALQPQHALLQASLPWRLGPLAAWLNLRIRLQQTAGLPALVGWRLGGLPLPAALAKPLLRAATVRFGATAADLQLVTDVVQQVRFDADRMDVHYVWQTDTFSRVLTVLTPPAEQERLHAYSDLLVDLAARGPGGTIPLPALMGPMFELAQRRSLTSDAAQENRAAVLTLALYTTGRNLDRLVPAARDWSKPRQLKVLLAGRDDFPQHFLISAFLAMEGSSPLTDAIGLAKEVLDAHGGSGFSFTDLAANRAGLRFGQMAAAQPALLQQRLAQGVSEGTLLPPVADLPEFLPQVDFEARYGQVGSAPYNRVLDDIEQRLNGLLLYR